MKLISKLMTEGEAEVPSSKPKPAMRKSMVRGVTMKLEKSNERDHNKKIEAIKAQAPHISKDNHEIHDHEFAI